MGITPNTKEHISKIDLPLYRHYSKIENYISILERALESLNNENNELRIALNKAQTRLLELEQKQ